MRRTLFRARLPRLRLARIGPTAPALALEMPNGLRVHIEATEVITATAQSASQDECSNLVIGQLEPQCCVSQRETTGAHSCAFQGYAHTLVCLSDKRYI